MTWGRKHWLCIILALAAFVIWRRWREGKTTDAAAFAAGIGMAAL